MSYHGTPLPLSRFTDFAAAVLKALPRNIDPEVALWWATKNGDGLRKALQEALCSGEEKKIPDGFEEVANFPKKRLCHIPTYFRNRAGLCTASNFHRDVVTQFQEPVEVHANPQDSGIIRCLRSHEISSAMSDISGYLEGKTFFLDEIAQLVNDQWAGQKKIGGLNVDGSSNYFAVTVKSAIFIVSVRRGSYEFCSYEGLGLQSFWEYGACTLKKWLSKFSHVTEGVLYIAQR